MAWPTGPLERTHIDQGGDDPSQARTEIVAAFDAVDSIVAARAQANGIASLDEQGLLPTTQVNAAGILGLLLFVDGDGSSLDADLLDGYHAASFILADGTADMSTAQAGGWKLKRQTVSNAARALALSLQGVNTPAGAAAGYGTGFDVKLHNSAGTLADAGYLAVDWIDATAGSEDAAIVLGHTVAGAAVEALRIVDRKLQMASQSSPSGAPPAGSFWLYMTSGGLTVKDEGGTEAVITAGGATDHNSLLNLTSGDAHTQYLRTDGSRVLTGDLQLGANAILATDLGADPSAPSAGQVKLYTKGGELYLRNVSGVVGPIGTGGGGGDHGSLTGLGDDDHTQYLLRQPTADVVMNDSAGDFDARWEGTSAPYLWQLNAGKNVVGIGHATGALGSLSTGRLQVYGAGTNAGVYAETAGGVAVSAYSETNHAVYGSVSAAASNVSAGYFIRTAASALASSSPVLYARDDSTSNGGVTLALWQRTSAAHLIDARIGSGATQVFQVHGVGTGVVVNEDGADYDVRFEGDTLDNLFFLDASADVVNINGTLIGARLNVTGGSMTGISATTSGASKDAILGTAGAGNIGVHGVNNATTTGGYGVLAESVKYQALGAVRDTGGATSAYPLVQFAIADAADGGSVFQMFTVSTGNFLETVSVTGSPITRHILPSGGGMYLQELAADMAGFGPGSGMWGLFFTSEGSFQVAPDGTVSPLGAGGVVTGEHWQRRPVVIEETVNTTSGASVSLTTPVPAGCIVEFVRVKVLSAVSGGFHVGVDGAETRFAEDVPGALNDTNALYANAPMPMQTGDQPMTILLTSAAGTFSGGQVHVSAFIVRCDQL